MANAIRSSAGIQSCFTINLFPEFTHDTIGTNPCTTIKIQLYVTGETTRKLAVLMHADVIGSTALVQQNETVAHERIRDAFQRFSETITQHNGTTQEIRGDALVAEFSRASDAVTAALEFQAANTIHNEELSDDIRPNLRVGIALGEVVIADNTVTGEGIVLAQRLEQLAEPGGTCVQGAVYETIPKRLPFEYENLGERELKGFNEPVRVFSVKQRSQTSTSAEPKESTADLVEKPSIAVLPLNNMSGDSEQEYFSDGITEDIITELSRFPTLYVVARHSSFAFKGEKVDIKEIAEKLGVQYVVEGSVRRAGNRVRITAQLIESETGSHIWADRYDRDLEDIFAVQDEVTRSIVAVLPGRVEEAVVERVSRKPTKNMTAYEFMLQAKAIRESFSAEDTARSRRLLEKAIALDPRYARAYIYLADSYLVDLMLGLATEEAADKQFQLTRKGAAVDINDVLVQEMLGYAYISKGMWGDAEIQFNKTLSQIINEAEQMLWCGHGLTMLGQAERAQQVILEAMRLDPLHPPSYNWVLGQAYYFGKRYEDVINELMGEAMLNSLGYACLAGAYAYLGRVDDASTVLEAFIRERRQEFDSRSIVVEEETIEALAGGYRKLWQLETDWKHFADGLRKAGLPG
ncbi:MAG: adenylate/guanylate cyclase domain-containing protein [bacterium]